MFIAGLSPLARQLIFPHKILRLFPRKDAFGGAESRGRKKGFVPLML